MGKVEGYERKEVICPFYKDEPYHQIAIRCEGRISIACVNAFEKAEQKEKYLDNFCKGFNYIECSLARYLLTKYALEDVAEKKELYSQIYKNTQKKGGVIRIEKE